MRQKTIHYVIIWITLFMPFFSNSAAGSDLTLPGRWSIDKIQQWFDQQPWLVGYNFAPSTAIDQLGICQADTFDSKTIDRELGWAAEMGTNTFRINLHDLLGQQDSEGLKKRIDQFIDIGNKDSTKIILVLGDDIWDPHPNSVNNPIRNRTCIIPAGSSPRFRCSQRHSETTFEGILL